MPDGFFQTSLVFKKAPAPLLPRCGQCGLFKTCRSPKMPVHGEGARGILIVGEAPGELEDEKGRPFVGKAGRYLRDTLRGCGVELFRDCWVTNSLICRPPNNKIPDLAMIDYCRPNLLRAVAQLKPHTIILFGGNPVRSLVGHVWREQVGAISRWVGWNIPSQALNAWVCPTFHPSYILRQHDATLERIFEQHLETACEHGRPPWDKIPDWEQQVEVTFDAEYAAKVLDEMEQRGGETGFDFENNCLKPEYDGAEVLCASASWEGKRTIAYPWHGAAIAATQRLVRSKRIQLIASNLKHEERWLRTIFGKGAREWAWDTMIAAHVLDNRPDICSLKFQAFVHLGVLTYDDHIKAQLRAKSGEHLNRAKENVSQRQLMHYNGLDSLYEVKLMHRQKRLLEARHAL